MRELLFVYNSMIILFLPAFQLTIVFPFMVFYSIETFNSFCNVLTGFNLYCSILFHESLPSSLLTPSCKHFTDVSLIIFSSLYKNLRGKRQESFPIIILTLLLLHEFMLIKWVPKTSPLIWFDLICWAMRFQK